MANEVTGVNLPLQTACTQCFIGRVTLVQTGLIGATNGFLIVQNTSIPIRQVPGPNPQGTPLTQLDGRLALVCGNFVQDQSGIVLNVTFAQPVGI